MSHHTPTSDPSKIRLLVYHLPEGETLSIRITGIDQLLEFEFGYGKLCDTSEIDGSIHFYPHGNA